MNADWSVQSSRSSHADAAAAAAATLAQQHQLRSCFLLPHSLLRLSFSKGPSLLCNHWAAVTVPAPHPVSGCQAPETLERQAA